MKKISKKVYQYDLNGNFISEYKSVIEATRKLKINHGNIVKVCHKKFSHSSGFIFSYNKEEIVEEIKNPSGIKNKRICLNCRCCQVFKHRRWKHK